MRPTIIKLLTRHPPTTTAAAQATLGAVCAFGVSLTAAQTAAIMAVASTWLALFAWHQDVPPPKSKSSLPSSSG